MTTLRTLLPAAVVGGLAVVSLGAAPAQAEQLSTTDVARDVRLFTDDDGSAPRPGIANGDVRRFTVAHKDNKVTLRATYRDLAKDVDLLQQIVVVETPSGETGFTVSAGPGNWAGTVDGPCARADHKLDYANDVFSLSVPRGCLDNPRWVRLGLGSATAVGDQFRGDDALRDNDVQDDIRLSPRLTVG